ncbi:MAG: alpha-amylase family glycosyl hydrolase, partial [Bradymonadia bacterium]
GDFPGGLKDLKTTDPRVRKALIDVFKYWIEEVDLDGFRIDTLKHVEPEFFEVFAPAMREHARSLGKNNFFMFGEAFDGKDFLLGSYTHGEGVDSVFYFSAKYQIFDDVFGRGAPTQRVQQLYQDRSADTQYGDGSTTRSRYSFKGKTNGLTTGEGEPLAPAKALVHFIDNHDVPRWLYSFKDALAPYRNAISFLLTTDGIPCIYYGAEQDFAGGPDPSNREDMWRSQFKTDGTTFKHMQNLIRIRKSHAPLRRGNLEFLMVSDESTSGETQSPNAGILAFSRTHAGESVVVVLNNHGRQPSRTRTNQTAMETPFQPGVELRELLSNEVYRVDQDGRLDVEVPANSAMLFVPADP